MKEFYCSGLCPALLSVSALLLCSSSPLRTAGEDNLKRLSSFFVLPRVYGCSGCAGQLRCLGRLCLPIGKRSSHSHPPSPIATLRILSSSCLSLSVCCALLTNSPIISGVRFRSVHSDKRCQIYARTFQMKINIVYFRFVLAQKFAE